MSIIERLQRLDERLDLDGPQKRQKQEERRAVLEALPDPARRSLARLRIATWAADVLAADMRHFRMPLSVPMIQRYPHVSERHRRPLDAAYIGRRSYIRESAMTKRLIDVDDEVLEAARQVLGTETIKDTVNSALRASVQAAERRQRVDVAALKRFAEASRDLLDGEVMADAWR